ncbi:MAG: hypothetical protein ACTHN3_06325 [Solirubrobacterales bacterium]
MAELSALMVAASEILLEKYREPAITAWNRLETRPRSKDFSRSLRAEVRDPLWMLTRQWQMGELEAEDAGSPIDARLATSRLAIDRVQLGTQPPQPYADEAPLETMVERERVPFTHALRLQVAQYFLDLHPPALRAKYGPHYREAFGFPPHAEADYKGQPDGLNLYLATRRRGFDGEAVLVALGDGSFAAKASVDAEDEGELETIGKALRAWFERQYSQPEGKGADVWDPARLSYSLAAAAPAGGEGQLVLSAERYRGGHLDWDSFDVDPGAAPLELASQAPPPEPVEEAISFLPVAASFKGMPNPRFWEIEERTVNFGALNAQTTDHLLLVFAEMGLVYGNDWFVVPYELPVNSVSQVRALVVTDVFGDRTLVPAADEGEGDDWRRWSLFELGRRGEAGRSERRLLLPSALGEGGESEPLERVQFVRDEMANMVWAIEEVIPDATGRGIDGYLAADKTGVEPEEIVGSPAEIRYLLGTTVPENWIPFLPAQRPGSAQDVAFQRAAMPQMGTPPRDVVKAKGVLLNEPELPWFVNEEEVPYAGTTVTRAFQRVRWYDGRTYVWIGRRSETGRGVGSSGLRFDQIEPTGSS